MSISRVSVLEYTCDRCDKKYEGNYKESCGIEEMKVVAWSKSPFGDIGGATTFYNFCSKCTDSFWEWKRNH